MQKLTKTLTVLSLFGFAVMVSFAASAQERSGRGINEGAARQVDCLSEITQLETIIATIRAQRAVLIACNEDRMVFAGVGAPGADGRGCVEMAQLDHEWNPNADNPDTLVFVDGNTEVPDVNVNVIRGEDGRDAVDCPAGYEPI